MSEPFGFEFLEVMLCDIDFSFLLDDQLFFNRISFFSEMNFSMLFRQLDVAHPLLSQRLAKFIYTSIKLEREVSPPFLNSTISVIESSLPLLILKLQNLMVCSIWSTFYLNTFSLRESLTFAKSFVKIYLLA